jgi:hypothetical protein
MALELIRPIVDIKDWVNSPFYIGGETIYPYWKDSIVDYFNGDRRAFIFSGSSRVGKSYGSAFLIIRLIYELSCIKNFPGLFGLSPTTLPKGFYFSFSSEGADSTGIQRILRILDQIPYFNYPSTKRRDVSSFVSFPYLEIYGGSKAVHSLGSDLLFAIFDEANERSNVAKSMALQDAANLWMEIRMRSELTYSINGVWGGMAGIISSAGKTSSFVDMEIEKAKKHGAYFLREAAVYDVRPTSYSEEKFSVYVGGGGVPAFIVGEESPEVIQAITGLGMTVEQFLAERPTMIVHPPVSLKHFYDEDLDVALQNLSGVTRTGSSLFVSNKVWISRMFDDSLKYPTKLILNNNIPFFGLYDSTLPEELVDEDMLNDGYDGQPTYISVDLSRSNDPTGFSAIFFDEDARKIKAVLVTPIYLDRLKAGNEMDPVKVVGLITHLYRLGVNIRMVTADGFQSDYLITRCKLLLGNEKVERFSADKSPVAHITMLNFMKLNMYCLYNIPRLRYELENLIYDKVSGKIDHPPNSDPSNPVYFKDTTDALACSSHQLAIYENLSYEDLMVTMEVEKARKSRRSEDEEPEDFYGAVAEDDEDFYSDVDTFDGEEELDPMEQLMKDILP